MLRSVQTVRNISPNVRFNIFRQNVRRYCKSVKDIESETPFLDWMDKNSRYIGTGAIIGGTTFGGYCGYTEMEYIRNLPKNSYYKRDVLDIYTWSIIGVFIGSLGGAVGGGICAAIGILPTIAGTYLACSTHMYLKKKIEN